MSIWTFNFANSTTCNWHLLAAGSARPPCNPIQSIKRTAQMEHTNIEVMKLEQAVADATEAELRELNDLQLAFIGGGIGQAALSLQLQKSVMDLPNCRQRNSKHL